MMGNPIIYKICTRNHQLIIALPHVLTSLKKQLTENAHLCKLALNKSPENTEMSEKSSETEEKEVLRFYLLDWAMRSISLRLATPALLMSLLAARINSSARVSGKLRGLLAAFLRAPSVKLRSARSMRRWGAMSTDRWYTTPP